MQALGGCLDRLQLGHVVFRLVTRDCRLDLRFGVWRSTVRSQALAAGAVWGSAERISSSSGKRPVSYFEKMSSPSTTTSKMPLPPRMSSDSVPVALEIAAAKLVAWGR